jgi:formate/nitrite transporter
MTDPKAGADAYAPEEVARRVTALCVTKSRATLLSLAMLGMLAGAFIGLGALFSVIVLSDASLGYAASRVLAGVVFSLGLLLVVVAGAELFTGNNLLAMGWAAGVIGTRDVARNWVVVGIANFVGAAGLAALVFASGHASMNGGAIGETYVRIADAKAALTLEVAFTRAVLCNVLVCSAVWMALAARSVTDKFAAIVLPVAAFVAAGFEHSVANMYLLPLAAMLRAAAGEAVGLMDIVRNLVAVVAGNVVGGGVLVALVYYVVYLRRPAAAPTDPALAPTCERAERRHATARPD